LAISLDPLAAPVSGAASIAAKMTWLELAQLGSFEWAAEPPSAYSNDPVGAGAQKTEKPLEKD